MVFSQTDVSGNFTQPTVINRKMKNFLKNKLTIFLVIGILMIIGCAYFGTGVSASDAMAGAYLIVSIIPISFIIIIDRICVWKFGAKKVNKIQIYILGTFILLFITNMIRLQLQG